MAWPAKGPCHSVFATSLLNSVVDERAFTSLPLLPEQSRSATTFFCDPAAFYSPPPSPSFAFPSQLHPSKLPSFLRVLRGLGDRQAHTSDDGDVLIGPRRVG